MARLIEQINDYIKSKLVAEFAAIGITIDTTTWSRRNILRAIVYTIAIVQNYFESVFDTYVETLESIRSNSAASSKAWWSYQLGLFQYSATDPQYLSVINGVVGYSVVDEDLRIITASSIKTSSPGVCTIKLAKGNPFQALTTPELNAATAYIKYLGSAGVVYKVSSANPDKIYIKANVYYDGVYSAVIADTIESALNNYLQSNNRTNFDGINYVSDIEKTMKAVQGIRDVVLVEVYFRADSVAFSSATRLVDDSKVQVRAWTPVAGYCVEETTVGKTFADTITYFAE